MSVFDRMRRTGAAVAALGLVLLAAAPEDDFRTDPGDIAGFALEAVAAPVTLRIFESTFIPIPADPGKPNFEVTPGYSSSRLGAGPVGRAVSSLVWPGPGVGDGFGNFMEEFGGDPNEEYPLRMQAQFPSGPFDSAQETLPGGGMRAKAHGLDIESETNVGGELVPMLLNAGTLNSFTRTTVEDGVATAVAVSALADIELLGGVIVLDSMRTRLVATTDGVDAEVRGRTDYGALTIAGVRYAIDADGVRIEEEDEDGPFSEVPALPLRLLGVLDLSDLIGVTIEVGQIEDLEEDEEIAAAGRTAEGLTITLDLNPLFELINILPLDLVLELLPDDLRGQILPLLGLQPTVQIALGYADVEVSATEGFEFEVPDLPPPPPADDFGDAPFTEDPFDLGDDDFGGADFGAPTDLDAGLAPEVAPPAEAPGAGDQAPQVAMPVAQASSIPDRIGITAQLLLLAGVLIGVAALGLDRLSGAALAGTAAGAACRRGSAAGVPDLRSWSR